MLAEDPYYGYTDSDPSSGTRLAPPPPPPAPDLTIEQAMAGCWTYDGKESGTLGVELEPPDNSTGAQFTMDLNTAAPVFTLGSSLKGSSGAWIITKFTSTADSAEIDGLVVDDTEAIHTFAITVTVAPSGYRQLSCQINATKDSESGSDEGTWTAHDM